MGKGYPILEGLRGFYFPPSRIVTDSFSAGLPHKFITHSLNPSPITIKLWECCRNIGREGVVIAEYITGFCKKHK